MLASNFYVIARNELSDQMIAIGWCKAMERVAAEHYFDCSCDREVARQLEEPVA